MMIGKLTMVDKREGWVIVNIGHPKTGTKYIVSCTFSARRPDAIKNFIEDSGQEWEHWKNKCNFRCVRAVQTIECYPKNL